MAEGLARRRFGDKVRVQSAGSKPTRLSPWAIEVMREIGVELTAHESKSVEAIDPTIVGTVITLCAEEVCPAFLGQARRLHWPIEDPASNEQALPRDEMLARFRTARDAIRTKLEGLLSDIGREDERRRDRCARALEPEIGASCDRDDRGVGEL